MSVNELKVGNLAGYVWSIADLLRGDFERFEYCKVIFPFGILRLLDCLLKNTRTGSAASAAGFPEDVDKATKDAILSGKAQPSDR